MNTLILTMPELERAARQWAVDFLHDKWDDVAVVTDFRRIQQMSCEDSSIILFQRAPPAVLRYVLQNGGCPWLLTDLVNQAHGLHYAA